MEKQSTSVPWTSKDFPILSAAVEKTNQDLPTAVGKATTDQGLSAAEVKTTDQGLPTAEGKTTDQSQPIDDLACEKESSNEDSAHRFVRHKCP